jgi:D-aminopeptidase
MRKNLVIILSIFAGAGAGAGAGDGLAGDTDSRARDLGVAPGVYAPGPLNAVTDVPGVLVGHATLIRGDNIRTGVTAILPHGGNLYQDKVPAGYAQGNGYGKLMGTTQIIELGEIETPILLTNTLSVADAARGVIEWTLVQPGNEGVGSVNAIVGETNDGRINDIRARAVTAEHALEAITAAKTGAVAEGAVGAGTGTVNFGYKGGIGTSSRLLGEADGGYILGVLVQTNFGGDLHIMGIPVGRALAEQRASETSPDGSIMIVIATDAPLSDRNLTRLARRTFMGIARTGSAMSNGSGDYAIAFSTATSVRRAAGRRAGAATIEELANSSMTPLFAAAVEATEEAVYNALFAARTIDTAEGRKYPALPVEEVLKILRRHGVLTVH